MFIFPNMIIFPNNHFVFFLHLLKHLGVATKIESNWFWESWSRPPGPKRMTMMGFRVFLKWILIKVTSPKRSRIIIRSSRANLFIKLTIDPSPDPKSGFSGRSLTFYRKSLLPRNPACPKTICLKAPKCC